MCRERPAAFPAATTNRRPTEPASASKTMRVRQTAPLASRFRRRLARPATPKQRRAPLVRTRSATSPMAAPATAPTPAAAPKTATVAISATKMELTATAADHRWATATLASRRTIAPTAKPPTARPCSRICVWCRAPPARPTCASRAKFVAISWFSSRFACPTTPVPRRWGHGFHEAPTPFARRIR